MNQQHVSVLMSVFNESEVEILRAINSILKQTYTHFELIIVNDGPGDKKIKQTLWKATRMDKRVRIIENKRNGGLGHALNVAISHAKYDIIARMDASDTSYTTRLEKQLKYMREYQDVDLLFTQWIDVNEIGGKNKRMPTHQDFMDIRKTFFTKSIILHPTMMARKNTFIENPYPEMARPEDIVLFLKLIRTGHVFDILEEPLYEYKVDSIDTGKRHSKIKAYSANLLPHLIRESKYYFHNTYFWVYFARIIGEYMVSRNMTIFALTHANAARIWKKFFVA